MSAPGPESIPTSSDRRSKRPTKKRALTPTSSHAASVDALFAKPDQDIRIPSGPAPRRVAPPPEIVTNVQGSSAGAGSGEFHVYKASRRREYERLRIMDEEVRKEQQASDFHASKRDRETKDDEKTRKNREKREKKMKARLKAKTDGAGAGDGGSSKPRQDKGGETATGDDPSSPAGQGNKKTMDNKTAPDLALGTPAADGPGLVIHDDD